MKKINIKKNWVYKALAFSLLTPVVLTPIITSVSGSPLVNEEASDAFWQTNVLTAMAYRQKELKNLLLGYEEKIETELTNSEDYKEFVRWAVELPVEQRTDRNLFIQKIVSLPLTLLQKEYILDIYLDQLAELAVAAAKPVAEATPTYQIGERAYNGPKLSKVGPWTEDDEAAGGYYSDGFWVPITPEMLQPLVYSTPAPKPTPAPIVEKPKTLEELLGATMFASFSFPSAPTLKVLYTPQKGYMIINTDSTNPLSFDILGSDYARTGKYKKNEFLLNGDTVTYYEKVANSNSLQQHVVKLSGLTNFTFIPESLKEIVEKPQAQALIKDDAFYYVSPSDKNTNNLQVTTVMSYSLREGYKIAKQFELFSYIHSGVTIFKELNFGYEPGEDNGVHFKSSVSTPTYDDARISVDAQVDFINIKNAKGSDIIQSFLAPTEIKSLTFFAPFTDDWDSDKSMQQIQYNERMVRSYEVSVYDQNGVLVKTVKETNVEPYYRKVLFNQLPSEADRNKNIASLFFDALTIALVAVGGFIVSAGGIAATAGHITREAIKTGLVQAAWKGFLAAFAVPVSASIVSLLAGKSELIPLAWGYTPKKSLSYEETLFAESINVIANIISIFVAAGKAGAFKQKDLPLSILATRAAISARLAAIFPAGSSLALSILEMVELKDNRNFFTDAFLVSLPQLITKYNGTLPSTFDFWKSLSSISSTIRSEVDPQLLPIFETVQSMRDNGIKINLQNVVVPLGGKLKVKAVYGAHVAAGARSGLFKWWAYSYGYFNIDGGEKGVLLVEGVAQTMTFSENGFKSM